MKLYFGTPTPKGPLVRIIHFDPATMVRSPVTSKLDTMYHDTHVKYDAVFGWGNCRGYAAQLSYALIYDAVKGHVTDPRYTAKKLHHRFKSQVVSRLRRNEPWVMCEETIRAACDRIKTESLH